MLSSKAGRLLWLGAAGGSSSMVAFALANHTAETPVRLTIEDKNLSDRLRRLQREIYETLRLDSVERAGRTLSYGLLTAADYKFSLAGLEPGTEKYKEKQSEVHLRAAQRILYVCQRQGGVFVKAGQYISSLVKILPDEFTDTLRVLQDKNPGESFEDVCRVLEEDLGVPWHQLFAAFSPKPIAAASLAQVHRATTHDGDEVAVKIQYPRLASQVESDFFTLKVLATVVGAMFRDWEYTWLFPELEESVHLELDFLQEATNGERVGRLLERDGRIHIPRVRWDLSSARVLTMEFIDGVKVTDVGRLKASGIDPRAVGETISNLFSLMVFSLGLVHCDPHPGNLLIRHPPPPPSAPRRWAWRLQGLLGLRPNFEVVLLDHGLYRRLDESFRQSYCNLWKAFVTRDAGLGRAATRAMGLDEDFFELLSIISVNRTPTSRNGLGEQMSESERKRIREKYRDRSKYGAEQLKKLIESLPRDVLFVLRSNSLVRSLNTELGANVGTRFRIFGSSAMTGLSMPAPRVLPSQAYFLDEIRDYSHVLPGGGRVLQKRKKSEMLNRPEAPLNSSTASEAVLFSSYTRPSLWKEVQRQVMLTDLRLRLWLVDAAFEWMTWLRRRIPSNAQALPVTVGGEKMVERQLHVDLAEEGDKESTGGDAK
ncbi:hypothetical protein NSK_007030 [Nannochloropsis salina CCMP1776]|uniref:ABC1 atypical kinase-like domain-containing protein n=1 Tax=Nannochloropsis salina CCMP1776 TaxID=1027361 RepID=A0A4D9CRE9_9STRA|nr:hypothetical protein NSK_007030 [Nannochloropsis salina CCMP1776]|eukprot:TFJ81782.1 hypothetical protein NSK_007030 [Nannochloropsis salina CCMP1776]